ncbi:hypothetical protein EGW08_009427, partial [Elysia chlorotica]
AWYWEVTEDIRAAREADFGLHQTGVIHDVEKDTIYRLRLMAYSNGGYGTKSMEVYFTLGGQVSYDPLTSEIRNGSPRMQAALSLFLPVLSCWLLALLHRTL